MFNAHATFEFFLLNTSGVSQIFEILEDIIFVGKSYQKKNYPIWQTIIVFSFGQFLEKCYKKNFPQKIHLLK